MSLEHKNHLSSYNLEHFSEQLYFTTVKNQRTSDVGVYTASAATNVTNVLGMHRITLPENLFRKNNPTTTFIDVRWSTPTSLC